MSVIKFLPDYADSCGRGGMPLDKVGVKDVKMFRKDFSEERVLTTQSAYINLTNKNGIHMSRLITELMKYENEPIRMHENLLRRLAVSHETNNAYWECIWDALHYMENDQPLLVQCGLEGRYSCGEYGWYLTLRVPYASVCPCSAEMTKQVGSGHPHMQRALAKITGQLKGDEDLDEFLTTILAKVVGVVGLVPIPIMKRPDELEWCQKAEEYNLFVEDAARVIGAEIGDWFDDWVIACEHYESIHQHSVVAICRKGDKLV